MLKATDLEPRERSSSIFQKERVLNALIMNAHKTQLNKIVLFIDEAGKMSESDFDRLMDIYNNLVYLCPICAEVNYHSIFHTIAGLEICPFHHIRMVKTNITFDISSCTGRDRKRRIEAFRKGIFFNSRSGREVDDFVRNSTCRRIIAISTNSADGKLCHAGSVLFGKYSEKILACVKESEDQTDPGYLFLDWVNSTRLIGDFWSRKYYTIDRHLFNNVSKIRLLEYYIIKQFIQKYDNPYYKRIYEHVTEDLVSGRRIHYWETFLLKLCYVWAVVDCKEPVEALQTYRLFHPSTGTLHFRQISGVSAVDLLSQLCDDLNYSATAYQIAYIILKDQFDYLFQQYVSLASRKEGVDSLDGWKGLSAPEYYVILYEGNKGYEIVRISL